MMNSRIPPRPISTPSPLAASHLEDGPFSERGHLERSCGSVMLRASGGPTPPKTRNEGEIEKVKVYARIRPALRDDETPGALVWSEDGGQLTIFRPDAPVPQSDFTYDKVLGPSASQADVYTAAVSDVVADVLRGYNGTILAYGQTGAGKTYTLGNTAPDAIGMIPRAAAELFSAAARDTVNMYRITMSYIQIYMEMIQDLLNPTADNLPIREDSGGVFVAGACEVPVTSLEECLHYLELGEQNRVFAFTHLNAHSSRSHAVVMLTAVKSRKYLTDEERAQAESPDQDGVVTQKVTVGKLYMVDLAGSERLKKSKSVGLRATEARSINLSLTMLGMCISARAQDSPHVPFRDSKLTRLLQESLGGNAKTSLILCLSDVRQHADESLQSLQFGARAARVCNKPVVNERLQMRQLTAELLAALEEGNERTNGLEAALTQTKEERDALQAALARERARSAAIVEALRSESRVKDEQAAAKLAQQAELLSEHVQQLGHVQQQQGQLAKEVAKLREEQLAREQAHQAEVAELQQRLAAVQAAAAERQALEAEARSQQAHLAAVAQQQAAALVSQLAAERAAAREQAASIHLALTRLQRALGELVTGPTVAEDRGAGCVGTGPAGRWCSGGGRSSDGGGSGGSGPTLSRPAWMAASLAAAAAAAVSRRGLSSGSCDGSGGSGSGGGSTAVQMIQAALGLAGASPDGADDASAAAAAASTSLSRGVEFDGAAAAGPTAAAIAALVGSDDAGPADGPRRLRASQSLGSTAAGGGGGSARDRALTAPPQGGSALAVALRSALSASMPGALPAQQLQHFQQLHHHYNHQQRQPQAAATAAASAALNGGSGGADRRSASASHALASSDIGDIDAALAAAQQDLLADLRISAAAAVSGSGTGSGSASAAPPGWSSGVRRTHGLTWPLPSPAAAAVAVAASSARGAAAHHGPDSARQLSPPHSGRNSASGGAAGNGGSGSGGYASDYAAAVANGTVSPGRQYRSYSQLHGASAAAAVFHGLAAKPPRANGTGGGGGAGTLDGSGGGGGGALRDESSGQSCASVSIPCPPSVTLGRGSSAAATPTASTTTAGYSHGHPHPHYLHYSQQGQGHPLSTPFMDEHGRQAATAASPSPTSRDMTAAACGGLPVDLHTCPGILNLNPAFDTCESEVFTLKTDDVLMSSLAAAVSQPQPPSSSSSSSSSSSLTMAAAARERLPSEATAALAAATNMTLLAPAPPGALPPLPLPLFAGIQVQLDALLDIASVLRRLKTGLEARVVAQACELARRQEEQQHLETQSRGELQASRSALAAAESQLAASSQELDALRFVLAETVDELGRTRRQLDERGEQLEEQQRRLDDAAGLYDSALMRMGETRGRLDEALCELDSQRGEVARLRGELDAAKVDLASERAALALSAAASARSQAVTTQALAARHELQRQVRAANAIKRAFKAFKLAQLKGQVEAKQRELREAEAVRREREALQAARAGQALVQESVGVIRDAVGSILAAFVGRRHQLEAAKSLQTRMERIMSQGGASGAGSMGGYRASSGGGSKAYSASVSARMPPLGLVLTSAAAAPAGATMTVSAGGARSAAAPQAAAAAPQTPARGRRQMSSPLSVMLSAMTLPQPQTPASASTAASAGRPVGGVDAGVGGWGPTRGLFPPAPVQSQDDTVTTGSSVTPLGTVAGSSSRGGSGARGSAGGGAEHGPAVSGLGGDSSEVRSGGCGDGEVAAVSGGASDHGGSGSGGGDGHGDAAEARLASRSGSSACCGRGSAAAGATVAVLDDPGGPSPAACSPCSSSSSCSGVGAGRLRDAAGLAPAVAEALEAATEAGFGASSPPGRGVAEPPAAATDVTGAEDCALGLLPPRRAPSVPTGAAATTREP